jgi:hypothetical protein
MSRYEFRFPCTREKAALMDKKISEIQSTRKELFNSFIDAWLEELEAAQREERLMKKRNKSSPPAQAEVN